MPGRRLAPCLCLLLTLPTALAACASSSAPRQGVGQSVSATVPARASSSDGGGIDDVPSRLPAAGSTPATQPRCGGVPSSSGPLAHLARLTITLPPSAGPGDSVPVLASLSASAGLPRVITTPATSALLVVQDEQVVGITRDATLPEVPLMLAGTATQPAQALPRAIRLDGCPSGGTTSALPAGRYSVVAALGYRLDNLYSGTDGGGAAPQSGGLGFVLISPPVTITLR